MKGTFFTDRQKRFMDLPVESEDSAPPPRGPARCCEKAEPDMCTCQAVGWKCPEHGYRAEPCNPRFTHD